VPDSDPDRPLVLSALQKLRAGNEQLFYTTQVLAEFWTVCTRPATSRGGYGLSPAKTERKARMIERYCGLLTESLATHQEWRRLIVVHSVQGVVIHDTRLVAVMRVHGITHLLTFNKDDFKRFSGILVLSPPEV
jgi:predicted nucleic acid-binding protein